MPTPRVSKDKVTPEDVTGAATQTSLIEEPAQSVDCVAIDSATPETVWVDEDTDLYFEVFPNGDRRFEMPVTGHEFTVRPVTIGDVIDLEKSLGSIAELGLEAYARLLARIAIDTTFPFEGALTDKISQIKQQIPTEPDLSLASRALMHTSELDSDAKAENIEVETEMIGDLPIKTVVLPRSGITVRLRTEMTQDSALIAKSMGGQQAFDKRPVEAFAMRVARLCVGWDERTKITSSDVKELRFGADFHALNKALRFFRRSRRARP